MTKKLFALIMIVILISNTFLAGVAANVKANGDNLSTVAAALQNSMDEIVSGDAYDDAKPEENKDRISGTINEICPDDVSVSGQSNVVGAMQDSESDVHKDKSPEGGNDAADTSSVPIEEETETSGEAFTDIQIEDVVSSGPAQDIVTTGSAALPVINSDDTPPYRVTAVLNGGEISGDGWQKDSDGRYYKNTNDAGMITLPTVTYEGYTLRGWATSESGEVVYVDKDDIQLNTDISLYAVWEINKYTVEFLEEKGGRPIWSVDVDYGYTLWSTLSQMPWLDSATDWDDNKATVTLRNEQVEVTRIPSGYTETGYYYTFKLGSNNYFTVADGVLARVNELNPGYTFIDWYYEGYGHDIISFDTRFYPRCINTNAFVANVSYQYQERGTAAPSSSHIIEFNSTAQQQTLTFTFTTEEIVNYMPYIISDSDEGVTMTVDGGEIKLRLTGVESYTSYDNDTKQYTYTININVNEASFKKADGTIVGGEIIDDPDQAGGIYYIDFEIEYRPEPTGYTIRYFGEMLDDDGSSVYTDHYVMYMYDVIKYDTDTEQWTATRYRADVTSAIDMTEYQIKNNDGTSIYYYACEASAYEVVGDYQFDIPKAGFYVGDEVQIDYPTTTGFSVDRNKRWAMYTLDNTAENQEDTSVIEDTTAIALLYTKNPTVNIFFNRIEYYLYYVTNGGNTLERKVLPYGAKVSDPDTVIRAGYTPDKSKGTNGWEYHSISPDGALIGEKGEMPNTMPAFNTYAVMNWTVAERSYHIRLWIEEANTPSYTVQTSFQVDVAAPTDGTTPTVDVDDIISAIDNKDNNNEVYFQIRKFLQDNYTLKSFFSFNEGLVRADYGGADDIAPVEISADGTTVINIYYSRNVYTLEFVLARQSNSWWDNYPYQVASATGGAFDAASWSNTAGSSDFPTITVSDNNVIAENKGNYIKYTLNNSDNSAYGIYTTNHTINGYNVAVYYIVAKYGADISKLWLVNGGNLSVNESYNNLDYVSFGTDANSQYYYNHSNKNILSSYSTMNNDLLLKSDGTAMGTVAGYRYDVNQANDVSHRMVSYWYWTGNISKYTYYYLYETPDSTARTPDYTVNGANIISQGGSPISTIYTLNSVVQDISNDTYYAVTESNSQNSTNTVQNQNQPVKTGYSSRGKLYVTNNRYVYFFYDRNRYEISLHNVDAGYALSNLTADEKNTLLNLDITDLRDSTKTTSLAKQGFIIENNTLKVKYGTNLKYLADEAISNYLTGIVGNKLAYPNPRGEKAWTFGGWYLDNECVEDELSGVNAEMVTNTNSNVTLYAKWIPPTYTITYHLTEGKWDSIFVWANSSDPDYVNKQVTLVMGTTNIYAAELDESDYMPQPATPTAAGYSFYGWFYFTDEGTGTKVYLRDILTYEERASYSEGDVYIDLNHKVWRIHRDENGLFYYSGEKANRYLYGTETIYTDLDIYAAWERTYSDQLEIWHMISQETVNQFGVDTTQYTQYQINGLTYYLVGSETRTQLQSGIELSVSPEYTLKIVGESGEYALLPDAEFKRIILNEDDNPQAEFADETTAAFEGEERFYTVEEDGTLKYYLIFEYELATSVEYKVWYIEYDEAVENGILNQGEYFSRDTPPKDYGNSRIFIMQPKTLYTNLTSAEASRVSVVGTVISGYTLITDYQQELNLLSDSTKNNIYFYYRRNASDTTYTLEFKIMDEADNIYRNKSIKIKNMPGVIGTTLTAQNLADYFADYLDEALESKGVNGTKPKITITDENGSLIEYDLANVTLTEEQRQELIDMLKGTARDRDRGASYVLINNNPDTNTITVYMRYGSINLKKTDVKGNPLWAKVKLERYKKDVDGTLILDKEIGIYEFKDGVIDFYGLYIDDEYVYRITEVATTSGYSLLKEPIDITLPFMRGKDAAQTEGYDYRDEEGNYYWFDLSCTVANNTVFNVPITGMKPHLLYTVGSGVGLMYLSLALLLKRRESSG